MTVLTRVQNIASRGMCFSSTGTRPGHGDPYALQAFRVAGRYGNTAYSNSNVETRYAYRFQERCARFDTAISAVNFRDLLEQAVYLPTLHQASGYPTCTGYGLSRNVSPGVRILPIAGSTHQTNQRVVEGGTISLVNGLQLGISGAITFRGVEFIGAA
jgi:hypothetical protein